MRSTLRPAALALTLAVAPALAQTAAPPTAPAPSQADQTADSIKQIPLTQAAVDHFLAAQKEIDAVLDQMPEGADQPDPATLAKLDKIAQAHMFADYNDYNTTETNIGIILAGIDPATKTYIGAEAVIDKQIAEIQADKQMAAKDKKDTIDQLKASKATVPKLQFPANVDVVVKNYDKLNEALPQD